MLLRCALWRLVAFDVRLVDSNGLHEIDAFDWCYGLELGSLRYLGTYCATLDS